VRKIGPFLAIPSGANGSQLSCSGGSTLHEKIIAGRTRTVSSFDDRLELIYNFKLKLKS